MICKALSFSSSSKIEILKISINLDRLCPQRVKDDNFLIQIRKTVSLLKSLREIILGEIKDQVTPSVYENALETILSKRGLERFECQTCHSLLHSCGLLNDEVYEGQGPCKIDMKKIEQKNPFIKRIQISRNILSFYLLEEIVNWS